MFKHNFNPKKSYKRSTIAHFTRSLCLSSLPERSFSPFLEGHCTTFVVHNGPNIKNLYITFVKKEENNFTQYKVLLHPILNKGVLVNKRARSYYYYTGQHTNIIRSHDFNVLISLLTLLTKNFV